MVVGGRSAGVMALLEDGHQPDENAPPPLDAHVSKLTRGELCFFNTGSDSPSNERQPC